MTASIPGAVIFFVSLNFTQRQYFHENFSFRAAPYASSRRARLIRAFPDRKQGDDGRRNYRAGSVRISRADRKSTRLNSSHVKISYAVFCLKKKNDGQAEGQRAE